MGSVPRHEQRTVQSCRRSFVEVSLLDTVGFGGNV